MGLDTHTYKAKNIPNNVEILWNMTLFTLPQLGPLIQLRNNQEI